MTITAGDPEPLGASYDGKGVNFTPVLTACRARRALPV